MMTVNDKMVMEVVEISVMGGEEGMIFKGREGQT